MSGTVENNAARPAIASEAAVSLSVLRAFKAKLDRVWLAMGPEDERRLSLATLRYRMGLLIESLVEFGPVLGTFVSLKVSADRPSLNSEKRMSLGEQLHRWKCYKDDRWPGVTLDDENDHYHEWVEAGCPEWEGGGA